MKFLILILAATNLLLAVIPGIDMISLNPETTQGCCRGYCKQVADEEKPSDQQPMKEDGCPDNNCNPFQVCSSCVLICFDFTQFDIPEPAFSAKNYSFYSPDFHSQFSPDFWQPPKIV